MQLIQRMKYSEYKEYRERIVGYQLMHGQEEGWYINELTGAGLIYWYQTYVKKDYAQRPLVLVSEETYNRHIALEELMSLFDRDMHEHWKASINV
jgi:hypothetical protein